MSVAGRWRARQIPASSSDEESSLPARHLTVRRRASESKLAKFSVKLPRGSGEEAEIVDLNSTSDDELPAEQIEDSTPTGNEQQEVDSDGVADQRPLDDTLNSLPDVPDRVVKIINYEQINLPPDQGNCSSAAGETGHIGETKLPTATADEVPPAPKINAWSLSPGERDKKPAWKSFVTVRLFQFLLNSMRTKVKEVCVVVLVIVAALATLGNSSLKIRKASAPAKFIEDSLIIDYEYGDLASLHRRGSESEVSFVMYYAPWDADCIRFRKEFDVVAKHFSQQIFFAAINCWWPGGICNKSYKLNSFPVLLAHIRDVGQVEYRGPLIATYIIPFLDNILDPVRPIQSDGDLLDLKAKHDAVLVGYFDFNTAGDLPKYNSYVNTAINALARDPWRRVHFGVVSTRRVAYKLRLSTTSTMVLYLWNNSIEYQGSTDNSENLLSWLYSHITKFSILQWITPSGRKSDILYNLVNKKPTLILFTPRSLILGISPYYDVLKEIAMDYFNCNRSPQVSSIIHRSILQRRLMEESLMELEERCHEISSPKPQMIVAWDSSTMLSGDTCCHSQTVKWRPASKPADKRCHCTACVHVVQSKCPSSCKKFNCLATASRYLGDFNPSSVNQTASYCNEIKTTFQPRFSPYYKIIVSCTGSIPSNEENLITSGWTSGSTHSDDRIEKMIDSFQDQYCRRLNLGLNYSDFNFPDSGGESGLLSWRSNFTGLSCQTNRSLQFTAMDSILFQSFSENLGINIFNETHSTAAVIIDSNDENVYVLNTETGPSRATVVNKKSVVDFVKNYASGDLRRFMRSDNSMTVSSSDSCLSESSGEVICVPEVNCDTFQQIVLNNKTDVILMYYAPWCAFCTGIAHIYLTVAKLFQHVDGVLFARINGDKNDLPWEYTVEKYPTISFFPAKKKEESVLFSFNKPITTTNLIQFVLENCQPEVRRETSLKFCDRTCLIRNLISHSSHMRKLSRLIMSDLNSIRFAFKVLDGMKEYQVKRREELHKYMNYLTNLLRRRRFGIKSLMDLQFILRKKITNYHRGNTVEMANEFREALKLMQEPIKASVPTKETKAQSKQPKKKLAERKSDGQRKSTKDEL